MMRRTIGSRHGQPVEEATLESGDARIAVMNYGCVIRDWQVPADNGDPVHCILGFDSFDPYPEHSKSFGILAGRVANRTARGRFTLDGQEYHLPVNNGPNHLHGGPEGLGKRLWQMETDGAGLVLRYHSPDGEMGYPGAVAFETRMSLNGARLRMEMLADPDRPTPINLAQHNYYNLGRSPDILEHRLQIAASRYTPVDAVQIPTGEIVSVEGSVLDFRQTARICDVDPGRQGADHNLVLDADREFSDPIATLSAADTGLHLRIFSDQPGVQLFTAQPMNVSHPGHGGQHYGPFGGICLEAQHFPDSLNQPDWPSIIATPDAPYHQVLELEIAGS
ncbi:MAG: aldose epimerase family protein [Pseudomonadota bacterium]